MPSRGFNHSFAIFSLLVLAMLAQSLVPAGFMPQFKKTGLVQMEICTSSGLAHIMVEADKVPAPAGTPADKDLHSCPYAPVLAQVFVGAFVFTPPVLVTATGFHSLPALFHALKAKSWQSQGPPSILT